MPLRTLDSLGSLAGKRVIVRCDLNVPLKDGEITDDGRVRASASHPQRAHPSGCSRRGCSHLGRPDGAPDAKYSLAPVAQRLSELLGKPVAFALDTVGESAHDAVAALEDGDVAVIENLRFNPGETSKDDAERRAFADELAELGDVARLGRIRRRAPQAGERLRAGRDPAVGGRAADRRGTRRARPPHREPRAAVHGRSRRLEGERQARRDLALLPRVDRLLIGGGMLFTFLAAQGHKVGASLLEADQLET